jgi:thioredoxin reductase (NADPH)
MVMQHSWDSEIIDIQGQSIVESATVKNNRTGKTHEIKTQGIFIAIGHRPNTEFLQGILPLDREGYVKSRNEILTDTEGVFVAGDIVDHKYRQAITAASSGCKAALEVRSYLLNLA